MPIGAALPSKTLVVEQDMNPVPSCGIQGIVTSSNPKLQLGQVHNIGRILCGHNVSTPSSLMVYSSKQATIRHRALLA